MHVPYWLVGLAIYGCGASAPANVPLTGSAPPNPPDQRLAIAWSDDGFDTPVLPATSKDGTIVIIARSEPSRGEGYVGPVHPSFELIEKARDDHTIFRLGVVAEDTADAMWDGRGMKRELRTRIEAANRWLANIDQRYELVALDDLEVTTHTHAVGNLLTVDWAADHLEIQGSQQPGGPHTTVVSAATPPSWAHPNLPTRCATSGPRLELAWGDPERRIVVLQIAYAAVDPDACVRPPNQVHVVTW
jgi:hypothetical protein